MRRGVLAAGVVFAVFTCGAVARAQSTTAVKVFVAVDAYERLGGSAGFRVTGIQEGDAAATTVGFPATYTSADEMATCERMALLAMNRPGQYQLRLNLNVYTNPGGETFSYLHTCGLSRIKP